ncbi:MAG: hypothetical protein HQL31_09985, partial [Planctomycetes bacterium]|nr:hypothetical protein [Planctomycetota bacterium]
LEISEKIAHLIEEKQEYIDRNETLRQNMEKARADLESGDRKIQETINTHELVNLKVTDLEGKLSELRLKAVDLEKKLETGRKERELQIRELARKQCRASVKPGELIRESFEDFRSGRREMAVAKLNDPILQGDPFIARFLQSLMRVLTITEMKPPGENSSLGRGFNYNRLREARRIPFFRDKFWTFAFSLSDGIGKIVVADDGSMIQTDSEFTSYLPLPPLEKEPLSIEATEDGGIRGLYSRTRAFYIAKPGDVPLVFENPNGVRGIAPAEDGVLLMTEKNTTLTHMPWPQSLDPLPPCWKGLFSYGKAEYALDNKTPADTSQLEVMHEKLKLTPDYKVLAFHPAFSTCLVYNRLMGVLQEWDNQPKARWQIKDLTPHSAQAIARGWLVHAGGGLFLLERDLPIFKLDLPDCTALQIVDELNLAFAQLESGELCVLFLDTCQYLFSMGILPDELTSASMMNGNLVLGTKKGFALTLTVPE